MDDRTVGQSLEHDHHLIDGQFAAFAQALAEDRIDTASLSAATEALRHHIWVEEQLHFPPLREAGLFGPVLVMLREHGEIWNLLDRAAAQAAQGSVADLDQTWHSLAELLTAHNAKEEQILYPSGDQILDEPTARAVATALATGARPDGWVCQMAGQR